MAIVLRGLTTRLGSVRITAAELSDVYSDGADDPIAATGITALYEFGIEESILDVADDVVGRALIAADARDLQPHRPFGLVACSNFTHDTLVPTFGPAVAQRQLLPACHAVTIGTGCGGLAQAVEHAVAMMTSPYTRWPKGRGCVVLAGDRFSCLVDRKDYRGRYLFSDAVAAFVLVEDEPKASDLVLQQVMSRSLVFPAGKIDALRIGNAAFHPDPFFRMETSDVVRFTRVVAEVVKYHLNLPKWDGISVIPHQANLRLLEPMRAQVVGNASFYTDGIRTIGNTLNASTLFGLEDALRRDLLGSDDILLMPFGAEWVVGAIRLRRVR